MHEKHEASILETLWRESQSLKGLVRVLGENKLTEVADDYLDKKFEKSAWESFSTLIKKIL